MAASGLLKVVLLAEDMKEFAIDLQQGTEEEVARTLDATSSRLKMAEYIAKILSERVRELTAALESIKVTTKGAEEPQGILDKTPLPQPKSEGRPTRPAPLVRRHTTMAVPATHETTAGGWEDRAAAFMMRRRSQQSQQVNRGAGDLQQVSPPLSPTNTQYIPHSRRSTHLQDHHPNPHRFASDQNTVESQDVLWEFERRKQNPRRGMLIAAAFETYSETWDNLILRANQDQIQPHLTFSTFPWPVLRLSNDPPFSEPTELTMDEVREFVLSPFHSTDKSKESRIREAYVRFHPDKNSRWLGFVLENEREKTKRGMDRVSWCLGNLK